MIDPAINHKIAAARERMERKKHLEVRLSDARYSLSQEMARLEELAGLLEKEKHDLERLEGMSLAVVFYTVLGSKEEQLEKERQEALSARLKFDQVRHSVDALKVYVNDLERELNDLSGAHNEYERLLDEKERQIAQQPDGTLVRNLLELDEKAAIKKAELRETQEALSAGRTALDGLARIIDATQSAQNWGVWDMFGGGLLVTAAKHSRMDEAVKLTRQVQVLLQRFQRELSDLAMSETGVKIEPLTAFADYFFDGLIVDWVVQSKIDRSLDAAKRTYGNVERIVKSLERREKNLKSQLQSIGEERRRWLEKTA